MKSYRFVKAILPKKYFEWLRKNLIYASIDIPEEKFATLSFAYSVSFSFLIFAILQLTGFGQYWYFSLLSIPLIFLMPHLFLILIGDKNAEFVESVLPDALQLMAANIRSGLTPDKALLFSARPEFGILEKEIRLAASKAIAGEPLEEALLSIGDRIKSRLVSRTFKLIVDGMRKGGELANLLEQTSEDMREIKLLKKEISAQVGMYAIFILIATGLAAPLLFSLSSYLIQTMYSLGKSINIKDAESYTSMGFLKLSIGGVSPSFIQTYAFLMMLSSSIFGSLLVGILQAGKEKAGLKYIPLLIAANFLIFFLTHIFLGQIIGLITPTASFK
jgi:archaeal flagellar protein FlaJ